MNLTVDLDKLKLITSPGDRTDIYQIDLKRGDAAPISISFVRSGVKEELASGSVVTFGAKASGLYDGDAIILSSDFTKTGSGTTAEYFANVSLDTVALNTLLAVNTTTADDVAYVDLMGEVTWTDGAAGPIASTQTVRVRIANDVIRGDESGPTGISGGTPLNDAQMVITGTLTSNGTLAVTFPTLLYEGEAGTKSSYNSLGSTLQGTGTEYDLYWVTDKWKLRKLLDGTPVAEWYSSSDVATPDLATWTASAQSPATGVPTVTRHATPGRLGTMEVAEGFLYVVDEIDGTGEPIWKEVALVALGAS